MNIQFSNLSPSMKTFLNYLGQLRIYTLVDLVILLIATGANRYEFLGAIFLHMGFLAYLESKHEHSYREKIPKYLWLIFAVLGSVLYQHVFPIIFYLICSFHYTLKNRKVGHWGLIAPVDRGWQYAWIIAGIIGSYTSFLLIVFCVIFIRNTLGDFRDVEKDRKEGMKTIPIVLGFKKNIDVYILAVFASTTIWWTYTSIPWYFLSFIFLIQFLGYKLTPR